jgi:uncharacterized protein HemY
VSGTRDPGPSPSPGSCGRAWLVVLALGAAAPLRAGTPEELDSLVAPTTEVAAGMSLARAQIARGELLEALGSVERVLARRPEAREAQLLHASLRCRIDDIAGGQAELARLDRRKFRNSDWADATAPCAASRGN